MQKLNLSKYLTLIAVGVVLTIPAIASGHDREDKAGHLMMRDMMRKHMKACMTEKMAMDHETDPAKIRSSMMMQMDECMSMMPMDKGMKKGMDKDDMKQEGEKKKEHDHNH